MKTASNHCFGLLRYDQNVIKIDKSPFSIGRDNSNDLIISHDSISKDQALIQLTANEKHLVIKDNGSSNGTAVNSKKLLSETMQLSTGDVIKFGNNPIEHFFDYGQSNEFQSEIDNTVIISPITTDKKISLVKSELYQHGTIDHLANFDENGSNVDKEKDDNNNNSTQLKDKVMQLTKEEGKKDDDSLKRESISKLNQSQRIQSQDEVFALKQYQKIEKLLDLKSKSQEEASKSIDNFLEVSKVYHDNIKCNKEIINTMQKQFNAEISNFNLIISKYDKRLSDIFQSISTSQSLGDKTKEKASLFLNDQIEQFIHEKEQLRMSIIKQKEHIIMIDTELNLLKSNSSTEIMSLQKQIEEFQSKIASLEHKAKANESKSSKTINYNQCLINAMNQMKEKENEIEKLTKQLNFIKAKYSSSPFVRFNIDSKASIKINDKIDLLANHDSVKVEELKREKESIVAIQKQKQN